MSKLFFLLLTVLLVSTVALAEEKCQPWLKYCMTKSDCCRHLECPGYQHRCVPVGGLVIPGKDTRPIGPGPFPPGYIA